MHENLFANELNLRVLNVTEISSTKASGLRVVDWMSFVAGHLEARVEAVLSRSPTCSLMLTGGRSAELLYSHLSLRDSFFNFQNLRVFITDERVVGKGHPASNGSMVRRILFKRGIPRSWEFYDIELSDSSLGECCRLYESKLPPSIDVALLSIGDDGHYASIFNGYDHSFNNGTQVISTWSEDHRHARLTISRSVIDGASEVMVLAIGRRKRALVKRLCAGDPDVLKMPMGSISNATWFV